MTDDGMLTYTNRKELEKAGDDYVTETFNEYRWYLIYYPDSLVFMGNTILSEEEIDGYISDYGYAYPDTTHIWMGIDSNYAIKGDAFQAANEIYQKIVPNMNRILGCMFFLAAVWMGIGIRFSGKLWKLLGLRLSFLGFSLQSCMNMACLGFMVCMSV